MITTYMIGRVGAEPELKQTKSGVNVCTFSVAANIGYGANRQTVWVRCSAWRKQAEVAAQYLKRGAQVFVSGTPSVRAFEGKQGAQASFELSVSELRFIGDRDVSQASEASDFIPETERKPAPAMTFAQESKFTDDDIPF